MKLIIWSMYFNKWVNNIISISNVFGPYGELIYHSFIFLHKS